VALVTGASSGIGRAIALALGEDGASVCLVGRNKDRLSQAEAATRAAGARHAQALAFDLTDESEQEKLVKQIEGRYGGADILVHSAGIYARAPMKKASAAKLDALFAANVRAPYQLTQRMLPFITARKGDIVFINSTQGVSASAEVGQFAATQHAMTAIADSLRDEVNADGVRVMTLHVGSTATPRQECIYAETGRHYVPERLLQPEDVAATVLSLLRLPRTAEVTKLTIRSMQKP
jgi:NADP-dependent 3-hydroxy acid dehydrogenase YdfG